MSMWLEYTAGRATGAPDAGVSFALAYRLTRIQSVRRTDARWKPGLRRVQSVANAEAGRLALEALVEHTAEGVKR